MITAKYDEQGDLSLYKGSNTRGYRYTRDAYGNVLTYENSNGFSIRYTRDAYGNVLTYKDCEGNSYRYTRDASGTGLTYKNSNGDDKVAISSDSEFTLYQDVNTKLFTAGCRINLTLEKALTHWDRTDARAVLFTKALKEL
jgi:YD repeat-containing protein